MRHVRFIAVLVVSACARQAPPASVSPPAQYTISTPCRPLSEYQGGRPTTFRVPGQSDAAFWIRRIDSLTALVDTIVVHPDSVSLHVGQSVPLRQGQNWEGRRANGDLVRTFSAWLDAEDRSVARFEDRGLTGVRPGLTRVIISAFSSTPGIEAHAPASCIKVLVEP